MDGNNAETSTATEEKLFTQEQVNKMISDRINRFYKRYGVENKEGLDDLVNKSLSYDAMNEKYDSIVKERDGIAEPLNKQIEELIKNRDELQTQYDELTNQNRDLAKRYAFTSRNIKPELYNDIEMYFKGKGLDINETTLNEELKTHLDWCNKVGTMSNLGAEMHTPDGATEREMAGKLLGVEL